MVNRLVILGSGAAPGVPSLSSGWGACDPNNVRNIRTRAGTYLEYKGLSILIDTSPDLRMQLLTNNIKHVDAVLYTHSHADYINGIDDLREINRISRRSLNFYTDKITLKAIKKRFDYVIAPSDCQDNACLAPSLVPNEIKPNNPFYIKNVKITPLKLLGHKEASVGYCFDDGEYVHIADCKRLAQSVFKMILRRPRVMTFPLTTLHEHDFHVDLSKILEYVEKINPEHVVINHMSTECDYNHINSITPGNIYPAFDGMTMEF